MCGPNSYNRHGPFPSGLAGGVRLQVVHHDGDLDDLKTPEKRTEGHRGESIRGVHGGR
jgi:hypothetical protein